MKTSWSEASRIAAYLSGTMDAGNVLLFEANMMLQPELSDKVLWQKKTYTIVKNYGRHQLEREIEAIHQQLFTAAQHTGFAQKIRLLFTNR